MNKIEQLGGGAFFQSGEPVGLENGPFFEVNSRIKARAHLVVNSRAIRDYEAQGGVIDGALDKLICDHNYIANGEYNWLQIEKERGLDKSGKRILASYQKAHRIVYERLPELLRG